MLPLKRIEGKYEVVRKLSEGGMGVLYLVRHRQLDELRVIKILRASIDDEHDLRGRFLREAKSAIQLRHPNIAQLYDFSVDEDGAAFMVMEYINGVNLEEFCKPENLLDVPIVVEIALQSLRALRFLHGKGFVHRDIAPDNLMLTRDAEGHLLVKLIDLGIVKVLRDETQKSIAGLYLGKPRYSSPEQLMGKELDGRSDLYSFGIALFELLTGRFPIAGKDFASLVTGHLYRPPLGFDEADPKGRVPPALRRLVAKTLEKDPANRLSGTEEFARLLAGLPIETFEDPEGKILDRILVRARSAGDEPTKPQKGTTQEELDRHFDRGRVTPGPAPLDHVTGKVAQSARPTLSLSGIQRAIVTGDLAEATRLLAGASDEELGTPEVKAVIGEIEQRMAEREAQRRGARGPDHDALAWADSQVRKLIADERAHRGAPPRPLDRTGPPRPVPPPAAEPTTMPLEIAPVPAPAAEPTTAPLEIAPAGVGAAGAEISGRYRLSDQARLALEGGLGEVERLLALGDTEAAADRLDAIERATPVWEMSPALGTRFRAVEDRIRGLQLAGRLARAERFLDEGSPVEAEYELDLARRIDRNHPTIAELTARIRAAKADTHAAFQPPPAPERPAWLLPALVGAGALALLIFLLVVLL